MRKKCSHSLDTHLINNHYKTIYKSVRIVYCIIKGRDLWWKMNTTKLCMVNFQLKHVVGCLECQSRQFLLIAHSVHERILTSTFQWFSQRNDMENLLRIIFSNTDQYFKSIFSWTIIVKGKTYFLIVSQYWIYWSGPWRKTNFNFPLTSIREYCQLCIDCERLVLSKLSVQLETKILFTKFICH